MPRNPFVAPLFLLAVFTGGFVAFLLATFVVLQGESEFARISGMHRRYALLLMLWSLAGLLVAALAREYFLFLPFGFFILLTLVAMVSGELADARRQVGDTLFGYIYIGLPMAYIVYAKSAELWGKNFLLLVGVTVALCDVIGFAAGSVVKGPHLLPALNPGKTWPSAVGNLVGAVIGVAVLRVLLPDDWTAAGVVVLVVMLALGSVW